VALAGQRTAVNLVGIEPGDITRGMVLTEPGRFRPVTAFDAQMDLLPSARPLKTGAPVHLHAGAATIEAEVRLLDKQQLLEPGGRAWVRIVLREPFLILPGDRFIVRMFSPVITIGGGIVVDISGFKYRGGTGAAPRLRALLEGNHQTRAEHLIAEHEYGLDRATIVALTGLRDIPASRNLETAGDWFIAASRAAEHRARLTDAVRAFHKQNSLLPGIPRQDLKGRATPGASHEVFERLLAGATELVAEGEVVRLRTHRVALKQDETVARTAIIAAFENAGLAAPAVHEVLKSAGLDATRARSVLQLLLREGVLVKITEDLILHPAALSALRELLATRRGQRFAVSDFKDWTGVSRKYAIPLLEYLDRERITRRDGDARIVL